MSTIDFGKHKQIYINRKSITIIESTSKPIVIHPNSIKKGLPLSQESNLLLRFGIMQYKKKSTSDITPIKQ